MIDIISVPDRLKESVGKAEYHDVLNRFFA